jgi:hypothetical protein
MTSKLALAAAVFLGIGIGLTAPTVVAFAQSSGHGHASDNHAATPAGEAAMPTVRSATIDVKYPPNLAIQLFTAEGEKLWVGDRGWNPTYLRGDGFHRGDAFSVGPFTFITTTYDQESGLAEYIRLFPGNNMALIRVEAAPSGSGSTATVTFEMTSLGEEGDVRVAAEAEGFELEIAEWEERIVRFDDDIHAWLAARN